MGQVELIAAMLKWVRDGAGGGRDLIVMADRGVGTSPSLLKAIESLGIFYMMRASKGVRVMMDDKRIFQFSSLTVNPGESFEKEGESVSEGGQDRALG